MTFLRRLASFDDDINFRTAFKVGLAVSAVLIVISLGSLGLRGLNLGIDFRGGVVWEFSSTSLTNDQVLKAVGETQENAVTIQKVDRNGLRIETGPHTAAERTKITAALEQAAGKQVDGVSTVGPSWGSEVSGKALKALIFFFIAVAIYISLRMEWRMAVAALVAVLHDIIISVGVYSIVGLEVTPGTVIAFLTILGYSLYDTIVVFDKVQDNVKHLGGTGKSTYTDIANLSLTQTIMRSINTTLSALLPVMSILVVGAVILGATTLEEFGLALLVGLFVGAYSSVFVATPVLVEMKEREPRYVALRKRIEERGGKSRQEVLAEVGSRKGKAGTAVAVADEVETDTDQVEAEPKSGRATSSTKAKPKARPGGTRPGTYSSNHPPRPRKKGKKR